MRRNARLFRCKSGRKRPRIPRLVWIRSDWRARGVVVDSSGLLLHSLTRRAASSAAPLVLRMVRMLRVVHVLNLMHAATHSSSGVVSVGSLCSTACNRDHPTCPRRIREDLECLSSLARCCSATWSTLGTLSAIVRRSVGTTHVHNEALVTFLLLLSCSWTTGLSVRETIMDGNPLLRCCLPTGVLSTRSGRSGPQSHEEYRVPTTRSRKVPSP